MENIAPALLEWFYKNQRILPFRTDPSPYHVWLSEIMLQQTRVSAALPYYERFLAALPDIPALAACEEEKLHKLWEGLKNQGLVLCKMLRRPAFQGHVSAAAAHAAGQSFRQPTGQRLALCGEGQICPAHCPASVPCRNSVVKAGS